MACAELEGVGPGVLRLSWVRLTYRRYALRRVPGAAALPSLFVNVVQPTADGRVLAARMSPSTAAPGRWQLPGGSVEPPQAGEVLDESSLAEQATRELVEELGTAAPAEALKLWAVTRGENSSVGLTCIAPALAEPAVRAAFAAAAAGERAQGREPELDDVALVSIALTSTIPTLGESPRCPAVITTDKGFCPCSTARWILLVSPLRGRPRPWSAGSTKIPPGGSFWRSPFPPLRRRAGGPGRRWSRRWRPR